MPHDLAYLRARVGKLSDLATMPQSVTAVAAMLDRSSASTAAIADEISRDQVISLKVFRLVNSGFCGFRTPISSIHHATVLLGIAALRMLLFSTALLTLAARRSMMGFWKHSIGTARAAGLLAERVGLSKPEELAVAGLVHDVGKVVIDQVVPAKSAEIRRHVAASGGLQIDAERAVLGVTHAEIGGWLVERWRLPARLADPIVFHNDFDPAREHAERTAVVHLADIACRARGYGDPGDASIPTLDPRVWELLGLSVSDLAPIFIALDQLDETGG